MGIFGSDKPQVVVSIELQRGTGPYLPGDYLVGCLRLDVTKAGDIRGVRLRLSVVERSHWTTGSGDNRRTHGSTLVHADTILTLFGNKKGDQSKEAHLPVGKFAYPFTIQLPRKMPATIYSTAAMVSARLKGYVDIAWAADPTAETALLVHAALPRSQLQYQQPFTEKFERDVTKGCCCPDVVGNVKFAATINKKAFILDVDVAVIDVTVTNNTEEPIRALVIEFVQQAIVNTFSGLRHICPATTLARRIANCEVPPKQTGAWRVSVPISAETKGAAIADIQGVLVRLNHVVRVVADITHPDLSDPAIAFVVVVANCVSEDESMPKLDGSMTAPNVYPELPAVQQHFLYVPPPLGVPLPFQYTPFEGPPVDTNAFPPYQAQLPQTWQPYVPPEPAALLGLQVQPLKQGDEGSAPAADGGLNAPLLQSMS